MFEITEKFTSFDNLRRHYIRHVKTKHKGELPFDGGITLNQYDKLATTLAKQPVDNVKTFGYVVERDGRKAYNKYDKDTGIFVAYYMNDSKQPIVITCYRLDFNTFNNREKENSIGTIPDNE